MNLNFNFLNFYALRNLMSFNLAQAESKLDGTIKIVQIQKFDDLFDYIGNSLIDLLRVKDLFLLDAFCFSF